MCLVWAGAKADKGVASVNMAEPMMVSVRGQLERRSIRRSKRCTSFDSPGLRLLSYYHPHRELRHTKHPGKQDKRWFAVRDHEERKLDCGKGQGEPQTGGKIGVQPPACKTAGASDRYEPRQKTDREQQQPDGPSAPPVSRSFGSRIAGTSTMDARQMPITSDAVPRVASIPLPPR